jgi:hypothetical protein
LSLDAYGAFALGLATAVVIAAATWWLNARLRRAAGQDLAADFATRAREFELQWQSQFESRLAEARAAWQAEVAAALRAHAQQAADEMLALRNEQAADRSELHARVQGQLDALRRATDELLAAHQEARQQELLAMRGELAAHRADVLQHLQKQDEALRAEFGEFRRTVDGLWEAHYGHVETYVKQRVETAQKMAEIGTRIHAAEAVARQVEETVWEIRGVPLNVLRSQFLVLQSALDAGEQRRAEVVLGRIPKALEALQAAGQRCDPWTLDRMRETLERAEVLAPEPVKGIRRSIDKLAGEPEPEARALS